MTQTSSEERVLITCECGQKLRIRQSLIDSQLPLAKCPKCGAELTAAANDTLPPLPVRPVSQRSAESGPGRFLSLLTTLVKFFDGANAFARRQTLRFAVNVVKKLLNSLAVIAVLGCWFAAMATVYVATQSVINGEGPFISALIGGAFMAIIGPIVVVLCWALLYLGIGVADLLCDLHEASCSNSQV